MRGFPLFFVCPGSSWFFFLFPHVVLLFLSTRSRGFKETFPSSLKSQATFASREPLLDLTGGSFSPVIADIYFLDRKEPFCSRFERSAAFPRSRFPPFPPEPFPLYLPPEAGLGKRLPSSSRWLLPHSSLGSPRRSLRFFFRAGNVTGSLVPQRSHFRSLWPPASIPTSRSRSLAPLF